MKFVIQWYPICGVYLQPFGRDGNINRQTDSQTHRKIFSKGYLQILSSEGEYFFLFILLFTPQRPN